MFQLSPICGATVERIPGKVSEGQRDVRTDVSIYAHLGTRVPSGTGFGKLGWRAKHER